MMKKLATLFLCLLPALSLTAQDPLERSYNYPVLNAQRNNGRITPKPKVEGWATERVTENLNRGLVALQNESGQIYVSWRLLESDPANVAFNVYRSVNGSSFRKANSRPITQTTDFTDTRASTGNENTYLVRAVVNGREMGDSEKAGVIPGGLNYTSIKFQGDYVCQKVALADLNGDGIMDYIIKQPNQTVDPGVWRRSETTWKVEAYLHDGTFLWRKDLGWNIEQGVWYSPMVAFDFNGDGKAEIALKTAPTDRDYRDHEGRVVGNPRQYYGADVVVDPSLEQCPEWCSILDGMTGEVIDSVPWPSQGQRFGDYNRNNRNQMAVAYLDGKTPSLIIERGTYRAMVAEAYQLNGNKLEKLWSWDGDEENPSIRSQGAHQIVCVDVDGDGRDEIVLGSVVLDDNGEALWSTGLGHPDKAYVAKVIPDRPGLQIFYALEVWHEQHGVCLVDAATGEYIWSIGHHTTHVGDGVVVDIDPAYPGLECFATEDSKAGSTDKYMFNAQGERLGSAEDVPGCRDWIWWDGDLLRETIRRAPLSPDHVRGFQRMFSGPIDIIKYKGEAMTSGLEGNIMMIADLRGDWREEIVTMLPGELRIYSTTIPAQDRRATLLQDPLYRSYIAHRSMGYDQPPTVSYYLGVDPAEAGNHTPIIPIRK